jgi:hypothetical protein
MNEMSPANPPERPAATLEQPTVEPLPPALSSQPDMEVLKALTKVATNAWKLRNRVLDGQTKEPREELNKEEVKKSAREIDAIIEALSDLEVVIEDRTNEVFDYGSTDQIVSSIPKEGLAKPIILKTIRPTIYFKKWIAQKSQVDIATPIEPK